MLIKARKVFFPFLEDGNSCINKNAIDEITRTKPIYLMRNDKAINKADKNKISVFLFLKPYRNNETPSKETNIKDGSDQSIECMYSNEGEQQKINEHIIESKWFLLDRIKTEIPMIRELAPNKKTFRYLPVVQTSSFPRKEAKAARIKGYPGG